MALNDKSDLNSILGEFSEKNLDAGTIVFNSVHPDAYVRCSDEGLVIEAAEKKQLATWLLLVYYLKKVQIFSLRKVMIYKDDSLNGVFIYADL